MALSQKSISLLDNLKEDFKASKEVQESYDGEWKLALAFLGGAQCTQYDRLNRTIEQAPTAPTPRRRRRPIHNLIAPNFEIVTSKLGAFMPQLIALAGSPDEDDQAASRVSTALLYRQRNIAELDAYMQDFIDVTVALGTGVIWGQYNPYAQPPVYLDKIDPTTGSIIIDSSGRPVTEEIQQGDVQYKVLMPWQIFPDPTAYNHREAQWTELVDIVDRDEAAKIWRVKKEDLPEISETGMKSYSEFYIPMSNNAAPFHNEKKRRDKPPTAIHHRFDKPCAAYPRGRWVVWTDKQILHQQDSLPYGLPGFPFAIATFRKLPSRYWGKGMVSDLIQPQITRNFNLGRMAEYMNMMAFPPVLNPHGALLPKDKESWTGDPGQMVDYIPGNGEPHYMAGPPGFNMTEFSVASADMGEISNIPPVAKGVSPARERISGTAVNALRAEHQEALGKPLRDIMRAYQHMGKVGLHIAADKYEDVRIFYILGPKRSQQWFSVGMEGIPENFIPKKNQVSFDKFRQMIKTGMDVIVEADPGVPATRQERQEFVLGLLDRLARMPPQFLPMAIKMLSAGGIYGDIWATLGMGVFNEMMGGQSPEAMGQEMVASQEMQNSEVPPEIMRALQNIQAGMGEQE